MEYITDINEVMKILSASCKGPVYKSIGTDENGDEIAVPVFAINAEKEK